MVRFTLLVAFALVAACTKPTPVMMWVDGFEPDNIRFEIEDLGPTDAAALVARGKQGDVDGSAFLPANSCDGPCRAVLVTAFITNRTANKEPPPVMRLACRLVAHPACRSRSAATPSTPDASGACASSSRCGPKSGT